MTAPLMKYMRLGDTGLHVSRIGLGMMSYGDPRWRAWVLDEESADPVVRCAVEGGITLFDTADSYSDGASERITGRLLAKYFRHRDEYVLATKVCSATGNGPNDRGLSRRHIMASIDASLRRLGTDYVDLYQIHRWDPHTPIEETMRALDDLVRAGKVRYVGASSMYAWQFAKAQEVARTRGWTPFVSMQNHYNLVYREEEREMIPLCLDQGVGILPWSPLARGILAGSRGSLRSSSDPLAEELYGEQDRPVVEAALELGRARGISPARVALAWLLSKRGVIAPLIGATKLAHVVDAIAATEVSLDAAEQALLERPYTPHAILGHD